MTSVAFCRLRASEHVIKEIALKDDSCKLMKTQLCLVHQNSTMTSKCIFESSRADDFAVMSFFLGKIAQNEDAPRQIHKMGSLWKSLGTLGTSRGIFAKFFTKDGHFMELLEFPKMPRGGHLLFFASIFRTSWGGHFGSFLSWASLFSCREIDRMPYGVQFLKMVD